MIAARTASSDRSMPARRPGETCTRTALRSAPLIITRATPGNLRQFRRQHAVGES